MPPVEDKHAFLVMNRASKPDDPGRAVRCELVHLEGGIERIAGENGMKKSAGLFQKRLQRILDHVRKYSGASDGLDGDQVPMRKHILQAARAAILHVVMDRMVVTARGLKSQEDSVGHGPARQREALADAEIVEPALLGDDSVLARIEIRCRAAGRFQGTSLWFTNSGAAFQQMP